MTNTEINKSIEALAEQLKTQPNNPELLHNLSIHMGMVGKIQDATAYAKRAAEVAPNITEIWLNLGNLETFSKKHDEAIAAFKQTTRLEPADARGWFNLGNVLAQKGCWGESIQALETARGIAANRVDILASLALAYRKYGRLDDAVKTYSAALQIEPSNATVHSNLIVALQYMTDTTEASLFNAQQKWNASHGAPRARQSPLSVNLNTPMRVGYVSGDFRTHPIGYFLSGVLKNHDPNAIQPLCFSDTASQDKMTLRLQGYASQWIDTRGMSDEMFCQAVQQEEVDVLVDLSGHFNHNRLTAFAMRPAPIQVTWAGYVGSTGLSEMDWMIGDHHHTPEGSSQYTTERIARLPHDYICYTPPDETPDVGALPSDINGYVTFGCFNNHVKINHSILSAWADILAALPTSKLILKCSDLDQADLRSNIVRAMSGFGVAETQLDLRPASPHLDLLSTYSEIDIALDPWPYSGGLTTLESLWMGVPVVTKTGGTFAGRHSTSHLRNVGLDDWIVETESDYIRLAIDKASDKHSLRTTRASLRNRMKASPICDHAGFTQSLERAYAMMRDDALASDDGTPRPRILDIPGD